jgi:hypothetical protein
MSKELKAAIEIAKTKNELMDIALQINREGIFMPDAESEELYRAWYEKLDELNELRVREIVQEEIKKAAESTTAGPKCTYDQFVRGEHLSSTELGREAKPTHQV